MSISVIIPTWNEHRCLPALLADLRPQLGPLDEILVADGGSTDATVAIANAWGARVVSSARGRGVQLNTGAAHASGSTFWFVHADTRIPQDALRQLRTRQGLWGCFGVRIPAPGFRLWWTGAFMTWRAMQKGSCTGDMGIWTKKSFFEELGGFPEWEAFEDLDFSDRARARAQAEVIVPGVETSPRRWQKAGINKTIFLMWLLRLRYRLGGDPNQLASWYRSRYR